MGYKDNQFFTPLAGNADYEDIGRGRATNPSFDDDLRNKIRYIERDIDPKTGQVGAWGPQTTTLKRGYIRSLLEHVQTSETSSANLPILKCNFQFNPQYIQHSVPMRSGTTNLYLQDAAQFAQPISGDVTFGFELFFDRTYLLNNEDKGEGDRGTASEKNIGVLADLRSLYEVIGQGISESMLEAQKARAMQQAQVEANIANSDAITSAGAAGIAVGMYSLNDAAAISQNAGLNSIFDRNVNAGNVSFLIPSPVRVMFSSLFMVDGYVSQTDVTYTKFSSTLVPIQCTVALSMQAMYVGFAKKKTFFTVNLEQADEAIKSQIAETLAKAAEVNAAVAPNVGKFTIKPITDLKVTSGGKEVSGTVESVEQLLMPTVSLFSIFYGTYVPPPNSVVLSEGTKIKIDIQNDEGDKIRKLFDEQNPISINMDIKLRTYGPYSAAEAANVKDSLAPAGGAGPVLRPPDTEFISEMTLTSPNITTGDGWDKLRTGGKFESKLEFKAGKSRGFTLTELQQNESLSKSFVTVCTTTIIISTSGQPAPPITFKPAAYVTSLMGVYADSNIGGYQADPNLPTFKKKTGSYSEKTLSFDMNKV